MQVDVREEKIRELKVVAETSRENEAKQTAVASQLRAQLVEFEAHAGSIEGIDRLLLIVGLFFCCCLQLPFCRVRPTGAKWPSQRCSVKLESNKKRFCILNRNSGTFSQSRRHCSTCVNVSFDIQGKCGSACAS